MTTPLYDNILESKSNKTSLKNISITEISQQRAELELIKKDINDKERLINKLTLKVNDFEESINEIHELLLYIEKSGNITIFSDEQRKKIIPITHFEYTKLLKDSILSLLNSQDRLQQNYISDFTARAWNSSETCNNLKNEILNIKKENLKINKEILNFNRLFEINQKEKNSLQKIVESYEIQLKNYDYNFNNQTENLKEELNYLNEEIDIYENEKIIKEKKNLKIINKLNDHKNNNNKIEINLEFEIEKIKKKYQKEIELRNKTLEEYNHIILEIKRGKEQINKFKKALTNDEIIKAEKLNNELKEFIQNERINWDRQISSQIKKNKLIERQINDLKEEILILKPYLNQLEKKYLNKTTKLPTFPFEDNQNNNININNNNNLIINLKYKNLDDLEMKNIKKLMLQISKKKTLSKSINFRKILPPLK